MRRNNNDLRMYARGNDIPLWAIAKRLGVSEPTLHRHWREELPPDEKVKIREIITQLVKEREAT